MTDKFEDYDDYWEHIQRRARISLEETIEHDESSDDPRDLTFEAAKYALQASNVLNNYPRTVIYHTDNGFYGHGYELYLHHANFEDNDSMRLINALASAAYYNDILQAIENLLDRRDSLGECMNLISPHPIWGEGVVLEYEYEEGLTNTTTHTFHLQCLGEGEWKMFNPIDEAFEVISPDVMIEDSETPERDLDVKLSNICAKEMRNLK